MDDLIEHASESDQDHDLKFESTLLYVYLPDLCRFSSTDVHAVVSKFFDWLYSKGVRQIIELDIPDNHLQPLSDELISEKVLKYKVQDLNWRRLDINLDLLSESESKDTLKKLQLYSSGNWSTLYHWASEQGLASFKEVCVLDKKACLY